MFERAMMSRMQGSACLLAALMLAGSPLRAQSVEAVASQYLDAMRTGDWTAMAQLMHPNALRDLRAFLEPALRAPSGEEFRAQFLGLTSADEALALSDTAVFARFVQFFTEQNPTVAQALATAEIEVVGHVPEGADTVHVVYRMRMTVMGTPVSRMDVFSLARSGGTWRGLLKGDMSAMANALQRAFGGP